MSRILLIGPLPKKSATGVSLGFRSLVEGLAELGIDAKVVDLQMAGEPSNPGRFSVKRVYQMALPLLVAIARIPFSHVVYLTIACSKAGFLKDLVIVWWAALFGKRIVLHLKSGGYEEFYPSLSKRWRWLVRKTLSRADRIIALGESIRHQFSFVNDYDEKVVVIPNGPPTNIASGVKQPGEFRSGEPFHVLYLSNMIASKGYKDVLRACEILLERGRTNFIFHFCGAFQVASGEHETAEEFVESIRSRNLSENAIFHGTVRGEEKRKMFELANVFVLPTNYPTEGQPISIIEAMAYGVPVLASPWKGIVEQVAEGKTGMFVEFGSPEDIADKIQALEGNPERLCSLAKGSLERYHEQYRREIHVSAYGRPALLALIPRCFCFLNRGEKNHIQSISGLNR